jgi:hypothetical protein
MERASRSATYSSIMFVQVATITLDVCQIDDRQR